MKLLKSTKSIVIGYSIVSDTTWGISTQQAAGVLLSSILSLCSWINFYEKLSLNEIV